VRVYDDCGFQKAVFEKRTYVVGLKQKFWVVWVNNHLRRVIFFPLLHSFVTFIDRMNGEGRILLRTNAIASEGGLDELV